MFAKIFGKKSYPFGLPGLNFPNGAELEHVLIPATTGSGKSLAIHFLLNRILEGIDAKPKQEKALITDPNGQFASTRADKNDIVLNPFDRRSKRWNPFCEVKSDYDYKLLATAVIPDVEGKGQESAEWRNYAREMLVSLMKALDRSGNPDPREVQRLLSTPNPEALAPFLVGSPQESLLAPANERYLGGVIGVLSNALAPWEFLEPAGGGVFGLPWLVGQDPRPAHMFDFFHVDFVFLVEPSHDYPSFGRNASATFGKLHGWNLKVRIPGKPEIRAYPQNFGRSCNSEGMTSGRISLCVPVVSDPCPPEKEVERVRVNLSSSNWPI